MVYGIEEIENAVLTGMASLKGTPYGVRTLASYDGQLETEEDVRAAARLFPAVFVIFSGSVFVENGPRKLERIRFSTMACSRSTRGVSEAVRGEPGAAGAYDLIRAMRPLLGGKQFSMEIFPFEPVRCDLVYSGHGIVIYDQQWDTAQYGHLYQNDGS